MKKKTRFITQTEQLWLDEGREKGLEQGLEKGRQETRLAVLQRALRARFGSEAEQLDVTNGTCSEELLDKMIDAIFEHRPLENVKSLWMEENG